MYLPRQSCMLRIILCIILMASYLYVLLLSFGLLGLINSELVTLDLVARGIKEGRELVTTQYVARGIKVGSELVTTQYVARGIKVGSELVRHYMYSGKGNQSGRYSGKGN